MHVAHALARSAEFDLVHNHLDWLPLAFAAHCRAPLLTTIHGFSDAAILPAYRASSSAFVSISDADRVPELDYLATIYHGIDLDALPFSAAGGDDLVILGRIHPDKGTADAIRIAALAGRRLLIAGLVADERYFRERGRAARRRRPGRLPRLGGSASSAPRSSGRRTRCCTRSPSPSRSGCPWSRRWPPVRRWSRSPSGPCPRWSTRASPGSW